MKVVDIKHCLKELSLEEKASLCSGFDAWNSKGIPRLGIEPFMLTDGPHGLRKQDTKVAEISLSQSIPATCFPSGAGLASTWNRKLIQEVGAALGDESRQEKVGVILGPAVNIKRSPLCGRNFEYYSEDPYLAGEIASAHIAGVQSRGVGASIKHFAVNNQETNRMVVNARIEEEALREIYLPAFERAIRKSKPWTVMCAYNKLNGEYCSQNSILLNSILRDEWKYEGVLVTDWGACENRVKGLKAGQDLEMPGNGGIGDRAILAAIRTGDLKVEDLDKAVIHFLTLYNNIAKGINTGYSCNLTKNHELARAVAVESLVLLKNQNSILPLSKKNKICVLGKLAEEPRYQGGGSSHIKPTVLENVLEQLKIRTPELSFTYAPAYQMHSSEVDIKLHNEALELARSADLCLIFAGLPDIIESEGFDREDLELPENHNKLIHDITALGKQTVVVLFNGAPVTMPWDNTVSAILEAYLPGQAGASAIVDVLFGMASPGGRLAETFPSRLEDSPAYLDFPGNTEEVVYREGLFVGYRWYDARKINPAYPFGHGLSYTSFTYSDLKILNNPHKNPEPTRVSLTIKNTGKRPGWELVQIYVELKNHERSRPGLELRGFEKIWLEPGEQKNLELELDEHSFSYWNTTGKSWEQRAGTYNIYAGASSRDLRLQVSFVLDAVLDHKPITWDTQMRELLLHPLTCTWAHEIFDSIVSGFGSYEAYSAEAKMMRIMVTELPLRNLVRMSGGRVSESFAQSLLGK